MNDNNARPRDDLTPQFNAKPIMPPSNNNLPLGDRLRALIEPALEDSRRQQTQLDALDKIFAGLAPRFEALLNRTLGSIFNQAAAAERNDGEAGRNMFMIDRMTDHEGLSPVVRMNLPINTGFLELSPQEITNLPGYIALHEKARELNVALKLINVTADETKSPHGPQPAMLLVDLTKTYNEGAMENASLYPQLPEAKARFDKTSKGDFKF